jgi:hypothetical protein
MYTNPQNMLSPSCKKLPNQLGCRTVPLGGISVAFDITLTHPFRMTHAQALAHAQQVIPYLLNQFGSHLTRQATVNWNGGRCNFSVPVSVGTITGILDVHPTQLILYVELPFLAKVATGKISKSMRSHLAQHFPS